MISYSSAVCLALALLAASLRSAQADEIVDPVGAFLPTYTGPKDPGLDVLAHEVFILGDRLVFFGRMDGPIAPTAAIGGLNLFGLDRGRGTARFLVNAAERGTPPIGPNVLWDLIVRINPNGTGQVNNLLAGVITTLNPADIVINGNEFTASVPLGLLLPEAARPPEQWTYNLWPRNGIGRTDQVSDLAPDDGNAPVQTGALQAFAGSYQTVECNSAHGTEVLLSGVALGAAGRPVSFKWSAPDNVWLDEDASAATHALFPVGVTEALLTVTDEDDHSAISIVRITVIDTVPPEVVCTTNLASLSPPNHQMVEVGVFVSATDACSHPEDLILLDVVASSDEPDDGADDGNTTGDTDNEDGFVEPVNVTRHFTFNPEMARFEGSVLLRAERAGSRGGRTYTLKVTVVDSHLNPVTSSTVVAVPGNQAR